MKKGAALICAVIFVLAGCRAEVSSTVEQGRIPFEGRESSGITFDPSSDIFFVVSDQGNISAVSRSGEIIRTNSFQNANFEGLTRDITTGLLYAVIEGKDSIMEIDPETLLILREFSISRKLEGEKVIQGGKQGFEGITFVPDSNHPEGGTFFVVNQSTPGQKKPEPSALLELELPLRSVPSVSEGKKMIKGNIIRILPLGVTDLSGLHFDESSGLLYVLSDTNMQVIVLTKDGKIVETLHISGDNQEGITYDGRGNFAIVEDLPGSAHIRFVTRTVDRTSGER